MSPFEGVLATLLTAAALLLALAGLTKLGRPEATGDALRSAGLPGDPGTVRTLGAVELALAIWFIGFGGRPAVLAVGAIHLGFTGFSIVVRRRDPAASCGCFGRSAPVTILHIFVNAAVAAAAFTAAALAESASVLRDSPWPPVPTGLAVAAVAILLHTALTVPGTAGRTADAPPPPPGRGIPPALTGTMLADGSSVDLPLDGRDRDLLLVFLSTTCLVCRGIWRELRRRRRTGLPSGTDLIVIVSGGEDPDDLEPLAPSRIPIVRVDEAHDRWGVPGDPWAILVDRHTGRVEAEGTGRDWAELRERMFTADPSAR